MESTPLETSLSLDVPRNALFNGNLVFAFQHLKFLIGQNVFQLRLCSMFFIKIGPITA